ncbi:MAG: hypothetical protein U0694_10485 [Anaerolineae bacterium]
MEHKTCPSCGGDKFEWGLLRAVNYRSGLGVLGGGAKAVKVQRCLTCYHLLLYTDDSITRRDQLLKLASTVVKIAVPVLVVMAIARPFWNVVLALRGFSRQTMQVKSQLDTLSTQIENVSKFSLPQFANGTKKKAERETVA